MEEEKLNLKNFYHAVNVALSAFLVGMVLYYIPRLYLLPKKLTTGE